VGELKGLNSLKSFQLFSAELNIFSASGNKQFFRGPLKGTTSSKNIPWSVKGTTGGRMINKAESTDMMAPVRAELRK
jgi:hypothetical protein